jgi:hypothetical protein
LPLSPPASTNSASSTPSSSVRTAHSSLALVGYQHNQRWDCHGFEAPQNAHTNRPETPNNE